ncbi:MAG: Ig-like domain-containing protein [Gemmatimonadaceae bacterium]
MKARRAAAVYATMVLVVAACASPGLPPGGPERHVPPAIVRIQPDTNSVNVRGREFVIKFDEVISEHPSNASSLGDLVLISPRSGAPRVDWHRSSISIRPSKGWKANTAYTVTLLPGVADLRGNVMRTQTVVTFSTGTSIPQTTLSGTIFDWLTGIPSNSGLIEAHTPNDTMTVYLAASDSIGHYSMRGLPPAQYLVRGIIDANRNRALDPSEAYDTTAVYLKDSLNLELLAFAHDSTGPKLGNVRASDSVTLHATFETPLDPRAPLATSEFRLAGPDSVGIAIVSVKAFIPDTAVHTPALPLAPESAIPIPPPRASRAARAPMVLPKPTRPLLVREIVLVAATPLRAGVTYKLTALSATGPTGKKLSSDRTFELPKPVAHPDSATIKKPAATSAVRTTHTGDRSR